MVKQRFSLKGYLEGAKTIFSRNALLIIVIYSFNQYGNTMKNGFRTLVGAESLGLSTSVIGVAVTVFLLGAFAVRTPSGAIVDKFRSKLRLILGCSFLLKAVCWFGFTVVSNQTGYFILFALDGAIWAFNGTILPAALAVSVDRRAMGSGIALMMGLKDLASATARSVGISLFTERGILMAVSVAAATSLAAAVLAQFLNMRAKAVDDSGPKEPVRVSGSKHPRKGLLAGLCIGMIPMCIVGNMPFASFAMEQNYLQIFCEGEGFAYLNATTVGSSLLGIMNVAMGILCDIINPAILIVIAIAGQVGSAFLWGFGSSSFMISAGIIMYYATRYFDIGFQSMGMKIVSKDEKGAFQATWMMAFDVINIISAPLLGALINSFGFSTAFIGLGTWNVASLVAFVVLNATFLKRMRAEQEHTIQRSNPA